MAYFRQMAQNEGYTLSSLSISDSTQYMRVYEVGSDIGQKVSAQLPAPTSKTITIGDVMYGGTDTCSNATYTANSTAKNGGSTAKNKGSFSFSMSNIMSLPSTYTTNGDVRPKSTKVAYCIKY